MFVDDSIRSLSVTQIETAFAKAIEELTGYACEVRIHNLYVPPGGLGSIAMKFGRPGPAFHYEGNVHDVGRPID
jgi:hypothetical protein